MELCGLAARVLIDGTDRAHNYAPDYWEALLLPNKKTAWARPPFPAPPHLMIQRGVQSK